MAQFKLAFDATSIHEGGYSNHPNDRGGETYRGIARRFWPQWEGWQIVDNLKSHPEFPTVLRESSTLDRAVEGFYQDNFWLAIRGDDIPSQAIADEMFDTGVNMGVKRAIVYLQVSLNVFNREERLYRNLRVDGKISPHGTSSTLVALESFMRNDSLDLLLKAMNVQQGAHYLEQMIRDESQEVFARGWFRRVQFVKVGALDRPAVPT